MRNNPPEKIIMVGPCRVSIFRNLVTMKDGQEIEIPKVVLEVRYRDKDGRWRGTQGMSIREIPKAILALQKAFEYLTSGKVTSWLSDSD
ncbi:MAG: hypothetical protein PHW60_03255 [Kiritimatiellae bacterium]|nr:hypothetical protein [Kiritimatiellia bacterium]